MKQLHKLQQHNRTISFDRWLAVLDAGWMDADGVSYASSSFRKHITAEYNQGRDSAAAAATADDDDGGDHHHLPRSLLRAAT